MNPESRPSFLAEKKWFIAAGVFLLLAAFGGGMKYWADEEIRRLARSRGPSFSKADWQIRFARDYTKEEIGQVQGLRVLSVVGSVVIVIGVLGAAVAAIGLWIVRSANRRRLEQWMAEAEEGEST